MADRFQATYNGLPLDRGNIRARRRRPRLLPNVHAVGSHLLVPNSRRNRTLKRNRVAQERSITETSTPQKDDDRKEERKLRGRLLYRIPPDPPDPEYGVREGALIMEAQGGMVPKYSRQFELRYIGAIDKKRNDGPDAT